MDNNIKVFENSEFGKVRTVILNDEPWFIGKDVTDILGYQNGSRDINRHVDEDDRQNYQNGTFESNRGMAIINESGLYSLILSSKLPTAKKFKRWVTSEVLPSIRKHGAYMTEDTIKTVIAEPDFIIKLATELKKEQEQNKQLTETCSQQQQVIGELKPKADYVDKILKSDSLVTITQIAKDYGMSGQGMNKGRARIMGELELETGNIEVELAGKVVGHIVLVAAIIKNISDETGVSTTKIMKDITTALDSKWMNEKQWRVTNERTEEE